jgi:hypothetical protein
VVSDFSLLIPIIIYGGVSLVGALAAVLLPIETKGRPMMVKKICMKTFILYILGNSLLKKNIILLLKNKFTGCPKNRNFRNFYVNLGPKIFF